MLSNTSITLSFDMLDQGEINMDTRTLENQIKYLFVVVAAMVFLAAAYSLPTEAFFGVFAAGLFLIPAAFFIYIIQKVAAT
jgi:hypothetical protein